jgi:hypothetical protein
VQELKSAARSSHGAILMMCIIVRPAFHHIPSVQIIGAMQISFCATFVPVMSP